MDLRAVIFLPALVGCIVFGFVFALFATSHYLTALQTTGAGAKRITWPGSGESIDDFWRVFYLGWLIIFWLGPAFFVGRAFAGISGATWFKFAVPLAVFWVCYPVSQLSSLSGPTIWLPLHPGVFGRLAQKPAVVRGFALWSAVALAVLGLGLHWTFFADGLEWLFIGTPVFVVGILVYGRLLGRLAFALSYTKSLFARKKKKKPNPDAAARTRPATVPVRAEAIEDDEPEPGRNRPAELPLVEESDDGPVVGYGMKLDDDPPRAEPVTPAPAPAGRTRAMDDEDVSPYEVHAPEIQPEERAPVQVVKPREEEIRLISREDAPKLPKQVWTAELLGFLVQADTLVVVGALSVMCLLVGAMVRIARAFNPASDG